MGSQSDRGTFGENADLILQDLAAFYPHPENGLPLATIIASAATLIALTVIVFAKRRRHPYLLFGWLWYVVMFCPLIPTLQSGTALPRFNWQGRRSNFPAATTQPFFG